MSADPILVTIYDPLNAPVKGLASERHASQLPWGSGFYDKIENLRWADTGILAARRGITATGTAIDTGKVLWGGAVKTAWGVSGLAYIGLRDTSLPSDHTRIYHSTDFNTFSELSAAAGQYGNTRLAADADYDNPLSVEIVRDRFNDTDVPVFQNGVDFPRVWNKVVGIMAIQEPIEPPALDTKCQALFTWQGPLTLRDTAEWAWANDTTGTGWNVAVAGTSPYGAYPYIVVAAAGAGNYDGSVDITMTTAKNWTGSRQLILAVNFTTASGLDHFLANAIIKVRAAAGAAETIYDGSIPAQAQVAVVQSGDDETRYVLGFSLEGVTAGVLAAVKHINFSFETNTESSVLGYSAAISCIAGSGQVPGGSSYALTYYNSGSMGESREQVLETRMAIFRQLGSPTGSSSWRVDNSIDGLSIPFSSELYYAVEISAYNTGAADMGKGVDKLRLYRKEIEAPDFMYCAAVSLATYAGAGPWAFASGTADSLRTNITDNTATEDMSSWLTAPGEFQTTIPVGRAMVNGNGRLIVGALEGTSPNYAYTKIAISRPGSPFRFTTGLPDFEDPLTAVEETLGSDNVQGFVSANADVFGSSSILCFTDASIILINTDAIGTRGLLARVASVGTSSPGSIVERNGAIQFLDTDLAVQEVAGSGVRVLSKGWVSDALSGIPLSRRRFVSAAWFNDCYCLAYTPSGGTQNTRMLIFNTRQRVWESNDRAPALGGGAGVYELLLTWRPGVSAVTGGYGITGDARLMSIGSDTLPYRLENGAGDLGGATVAVSLATGDMQQAHWEGLYIRRVGVAGDAQSTSLTVTRTYKTSGIVGASTINLDHATLPYIRQWDAAVVWTHASLSAQQIADTERSGIAASVEFSGNLEGGSAILSLVAEIEPRQLQAAG